MQHKNNPGRTSWGHIPLRSRPAVSKAYLNKDTQVIFFLNEGLTKSKVSNIKLHRSEYKTITEIKNKSNTAAVNRTGSQALLYHKIYVKIWFMPINKKHFLVILQSLNYNGARY